MNASMKHILINQKPWSQISRVRLEKETYPPVDESIFLELPIQAIRSAMYLIVPYQFYERRAAACFFVETTA